MTKRLFIALEIPAGCREALAAMAEPIPGVRWLSAGQLHLTLAFLGNVDEETERRLRGRLAELQVPSFSVRLCGVATFQPRRPAVIWVGVEDLHEGLSVLHGEIHRALAAARIEVKSASFHPHVTLARPKAAPVQRIRSFLEANRSRGFGTVEFNHFTLFSSVLDPTGAIHHVEERYPLTGK